MNSILTEKEYQHFIMDRLSQDNGYVVRKATSYDRLFAMDRELLFQFLNDTQSDEMAALRKIYKADLEDTLVSFINAETTKARGSLLDVLKHGIEISNMKLELMYTKPATTFNQELLAKYEKNIFSVMEEVWASNDERVDLVIFLNGIAIMSFELNVMPQVSPIRTLSISTVLTVIRRPGCFGSKPGALLTLQWIWSRSI